MRPPSDITKEKTKRGVILSTLLHLSFVVPFIIIALPILRFAKDTPPIENVEDDEVMMVDVLVFSENEPESLPPSQFLGIEGLTQAPEFIEPMEDVLPKTAEKEEPDTEQAKIETTEAEETEITAATVEETEAEEAKAEEAKAEEVQEPREAIEAIEEVAGAEAAKAEETQEPREAVEAIEEVAGAKAQETELELKETKAVEAKKEAMEAEAVASERFKPKPNEPLASTTVTIEETPEPMPEQEAFPQGQPETLEAEGQETTIQEEGGKDIPVEAAVSVPAPVAADSSKPTRFGEEISRLPEPEKEEVVTSPEAAHARPGKAPSTEGRLGEMLQAMRELDRRLDRSLQEAPAETSGCKASSDCRTPPNKAMPMLSTALPRFS